MSTLHSSKLLLAAFVASAATAQGTLSTTGQVFLADGDAFLAVPGAAIGGTSSIDLPVMDLNGNMLCRAGFALGPGIDNSNRFALFYGRSAADRILLVRSGDPEPSHTLGNVTLNAGTGNGLGSGYRISPQGGLILFGGSLNGDGIVNTGTALTGRNDSAMFWGPAGGAHILVRRGDPTPGFGGSLIDGTFSNLGQQTTALSSQGVVCFQTALAGGDVNGMVNNAAWLIGTPGNLQIMLRKGDLLPGGLVGIGALGYGCQMNDAGQVLHDETLSTTLGSAPATAANDKVLMLYTPGIGNQIVVREGDVAVGTAGAIYGAPSLGSSSFTRSGKLAFTATLAGGDVVGTTNDQALFVGAPGSLVMVARKGDQAPGALPGEVFAGFTTGIQCNDAGEVALVCLLSGPTITASNGSGIWAGPAGALRLVARTGDAAPGIAGGVINWIANGSSSPHLNDLGQLLFSCEVLIGGATSATVLYAYDPHRGLLPLLQSGDTIMTVLGPQGAGSTGGVQFSSGDGCPLTLNNNGDFVRRVTFIGAGAAAVCGHLGALMATPAAIPVAGGRQTLEMDAGMAQAGRFYLLAGSLSGTRPGLPLGAVTLPLNHDTWFRLSIGAFQGLLYTGSLGFLDGQGKATAQFDFPYGYPSFAGSTLHHAFLVIDFNSGQLTFASEPASLLLY